MSSTPIVNPSEETINIGPLSIRFLLTGKDTNGGVSVFEVKVPAGAKLATSVVLAGLQVFSDPVSKEVRGARLRSGACARLRRTCGSCHNL